MWLYYRNSYFILKVLGNNNDCQPEIRNKLRVGNGDSGEKQRAIGQA